MMEFAIVIEKSPTEREIINYIQGETPLEAINLFDRMVRFRGEEVTIAIKDSTFREWRLTTKDSDIKANDIRARISHNYVLVDAERIKESEGGMEYGN